MTFDEKMKARRVREDCPIPEGFDRRMDALLDTLPARKTAARTRRPLRRIVWVAAAAVSVCLISATAVPQLVTVTQSAIGYFNAQRESKYLSQQADFEEYSAAVGASARNGGQTLTLDNIAIDDSYLNVFFTLTSDTPIEMQGEDGTPERLRAQWSAPHFWANLDGYYLETPASTESEAYFADDRTLCGMQRIGLMQEIPDTFNLVLYTGGTSDLKNADFRFDLTVDKSAVAVGRSVSPKTDLRAGKHKVRVEKVTISPFGNTLSLSEVSADPWNQFVLRDEHGAYLPVLPTGNYGSGSLLNRVTNLYEFIGADDRTQSVTIVPVDDPGHAHEVTGALDALPLTDDTEGGFTLETLEITDSEAVATFSSHGAVSSFRPQFWLIGANGEPWERGLDSYADFTFDRDTGLCTATLAYPDATPEQVARIAGVGFFQPDPVTLHEEQAVTIPLQ